MKLPTNNKQKQMTLGVLRSLYKARMEENDYARAAAIEKEIEKINKLTF